MRLDEMTAEERAKLLRRAVQAQIDALEARQARAIREATLDIPGARARLQDIDDQIAELRKALP
jgi:hypothetical protein